MRLKKLEKGPHYLWMDRGTKLLEIYYIKTYGIDSHAEHIGKEKTQYLQSLLGRINYVLSLNPKDTKMIAYQRYINARITVDSFN